MSIYIFSVLKTKPVKLSIDGKEIKAYRIKFHGKETFPGLDFFAKDPRKTDLKSIWKRAYQSWNGSRPEYGVDTPGYAGELDFNDPFYKDGFDVYKLKGMVAWHECEGIEKTIGKIKKVDGKLVFEGVQS